MILLYEIDSILENLELATAYKTCWFDSNELRAGSSDKVLKILFQFPISVVQSYFPCSIQFLWILNVLSVVQLVI